MNDFLLKKVCVIGLGRIGLPIALLLKDLGFSVVGVDLNERHLSEIETKTLRLDEEDLQQLFERVSLPIGRAPCEADVFLICVPTPVTDQNRADLSLLYQAIDSIVPVLKKGNLVLIESTSPVGTTDALAHRLPGIHIAYCPERVMPGNLLKELTSCDRIIGGIDPLSGQIAASFYKSFCEGALHLTSAKMAEAVKLAENSFRDVNLAFANELSMLASALDLSANELISLANFHPRVNILSPGPGVGGHCIPVDPLFFIEAFPKKTPLMQAARHVNEHKQIWVAQEIERSLQKQVV